MTKTLWELTGEQIIDSRDLVERLDEIEDEDDDELLAESEAIRGIIDEIEGYSGDTARDGVTLIAEDYWLSYAQELAEDIGAVPKEFSWPASYIDWDRAARDLKTDYTSVDIGTTEYWFR